MTNLEASSEPADFIMVYVLCLFDVYGNDLGWGRLATVRRGPGIKMDGVVNGDWVRGVQWTPEALTRLNKGIGDVVIRL